MASSGTLAGRQTELAALVAAVGGREPVPVVVITGEAGIGKSTLVGALSRSLPDPRTVVAVGRCLRLGRNLPYHPLVDVLRELHVVDGGTLVDGALARCPAYVRRELGRLRPELVPDGATAEVPSADPLAQLRLLDAVRQLVVQLVAIRPVVLVVEDAQWADRSTLELAEYLLSPGHHTGASLVLSWRSAEAGEEWWTGLGAPGPVRIELGPLSRDDTAELVAASLGRPADPALLDVICARTGGHPYFAEQLLALPPELVATAVPAGLRAVLLTRVADESADGREVLAALALAGRPLPEKLVGAVVDVPIQRLRGQLRRLIGAGLIRLDGTDVALHHALLGDAVVSQLLGSEQEELHRRLATGLADAGSDLFAAEIAQHWEAAGQPAAELGWRRRAAMSAEAVNAAVAASAQWERAIALLEADPGLLPADWTLTQLYLSSAWAYEHLGRTERAASRAEDALAALSPSDAAAGRAEVLRVAGHWRSLSRPVDGEPLLRESVRLYGDLAPTRDRARALHRLVQVLFSVEGRVDGEQAELIKEAIEVSRACGATGSLRMLTGARAFGMLMNGDTAGALAAAEDTVAIGHDPADPHATVASALYAVDTFRSCGDDDRAVAVGLAELRWIDDNGYPAAQISQALRARVVLLLYARGRVEEAGSLGAGRVGEPQIPGLMAAFLDGVAGVRDDTESVPEHDRDPSRTTHRPDPEPAELEIQLLLWAGSEERAVSRALATIDATAGTPRSAFCGGVLTLAMQASADLAEQARRRDDRAGLAAAVALGERVVESSQSCLLDPFAAGPFGAGPVGAGPVGAGPVGAGPFGADPFGSGPSGSANGERLSWTGERSRLAGTSDPALWSAAADAWAAVGRPIREAYARFRQAEALLSSPHGRGSAVRVLRRAAELSVNVVPLRRAVDELADRARIPLVGPLPNESSSSADETRAELPFGLTPRELAVLREIGAGRTNAQIAGSLFISRSTVGVHVSNLLRKLRVTSRVQAAAVASSLGLVDPVRH